MVAYDSGSRVSLGRMVAPVRTLRVMDLLGEAPSSLDTCHYLDAGQILTTTDALRLPTCRSLSKGNRGSEDTQMDYQCLKTHYDSCGQRSMQ